MEPRPFLEGQCFFSKFWRRIEGGKYFGALLQYVTIQSASHLHVLYTVEFLFRFNGSQRRSICVFGVYIEVGLMGFLGGPYYPK